MKMPLSIYYLSFSLLLLSCLSQAGAETLHDAIHLAWQADPRLSSFHTDAFAARKEAKAARAWFPDSPTITGEYLDDHFIGSKVGYTTYQGGINFPLWLPGQSRAIANEALGNQEVADANTQVEKLVTAVRIVTLTSEATLQQETIRNLRHADSLLGNIAHVTEVAYQNGELSGSDNEAIVAEKETLEGRISDAVQSLDGIKADLEALTGHEDIPDLLSLSGHILDGRNMALNVERDPRVRLAEAIRSVSKSSYEVARHSKIPNPRLGVMVSRQEQYQSPWDTQVGVQIQIPLPSAARNTPMEMKAVRAMAAADRDAILARRKVQTEYRQVHTRFRSSLTILQHSEATNIALQKRANDLENAWKVGEVPVIEYLRARRSALEAQQRASQANVVWHTAMIRMMLLTGETP
ncbi:TolC family protein [Gluconobacter sp. LMG 31484]|uniref:TolC family protein n=2 Tax=Gluconobacter vitians TaxID=2728102 RepID=A0ABR9Y914_9PROT|nr:TolC family protein [Gluconobacter vitians]